MIAPLTLLTQRFLTPWFETPVPRRIGAWIVAIALALAAAPVAILADDERAWLLALLLLMPLAAVVIARVDDDDGSGTATNPAWDLPDF